MTRCILCRVALTCVCNVMSIHYRGRLCFLEEKINFPSLFFWCNHTMNRYKSRPSCGSICVWCNWISLWVLTEQTGHRGAHYSMAQWGLCLSAPSTTSPTRDKMGKANSSHFNPRFISHPAGYLCPYRPVFQSLSVSDVHLFLFSFCYPLSVFQIGETMTQLVTRIVLWKKPDWAKARCYAGPPTVTKALLGLDMGQIFTSGWREGPCVLKAPFFIPCVFVARL